MATRSSRRTRPQRALDDALRHLGPAEPEAGDAPDRGGEFEDVEARAARLGVTVDKVLREYAWIAFADLRRIVEWDEAGLHVKKRLSKANAAPIAEISRGGSGPDKIKLYDKKAALDAIARHLGMFDPKPRPESQEARPSVEDVREELARRLARLAGETPED
ncbi:MAG TPA: terminase small subunit [Stellaceae bacterium]|nr:terminase small subunit [Stellaceae bacterium]